MSAHAFHRRFLLIVTGCLLIVSGPTFSFDIQGKYPYTISVLQTVYQYEKEVARTYQVYAQKALSEDYPNISYLFTSFAASESIHARNFRQLLTDLGVEARELPAGDINVSRTRENLKNAAERELKDIDSAYPRFIGQIESEGHEKALKVFAQTLESEKQHRDDLQKIRSGAGILFGLLAGAIESKTKRYFVCQVCGALADALQKDVCPICHTANPPYTEVRRIRQVSQ
jgi:rubrerythrin